MRGRGDMKRKVFVCLLCLALMLGLSVSAGAESFTGGDNWRVAFTQEHAMESTFRTADLDDAVSGLQPGDDITFTLRLSNDSEAVTDWYMTNRVLYSLEDRSTNAATAGGAYTYFLSYTNAAGEENVLFSSDTVGGEHVSEAGEGLHEATDALQDFFYLDTLSGSQAGTIVLRVALEGETQGNDYQDTLADLAMNFAVELKEAAPEPGAPRIIVKTGDDRNLLPYYVAMAVSGVLLLILAIDNVRRRARAKRKEQE